ncbi:unnamed protein product [Peniophora sp. CBMAI 1063]|nr:unnamed protein product [Peniophora sp. CBMAI 1063]
MSSSVSEKPGDQGDTSNLDTSSFEHKRLGAWDIYTQQKPWSWASLPTSPRGFFTAFSTYRQDALYVAQTLRDLWSISSGLIVLYFITLVPKMFLPSISLWYSG